LEPPPQFPPVTAHMTAVLEVPLTVAEKEAIPPALIVVLVGVTLTPMGTFTVTVALA
jgi:hypothetical protein